MRGSICCSLGFCRGIVWFVYMSELCSALTYYRSFSEQGFHLSQIQTFPLCGPMNVKLASSLEMEGGVGGKREKENTLF